MIMGDIMIPRDAELNVVAIGKVQLRVFLFLHKTYCMCFYINAHIIGLSSSNQQSAETDPGFVCRISLCVSDHVDELLCVKMVCLWVKSFSLNVTSFVVQGPR